MRLAARTQLSLVVAACLLGLAVSLKNVVGVSAQTSYHETSSSTVLIYTGFALFAPVQEARGEGGGTPRRTPPGLVIVLTTVAIVAFYAI